MENLTHMIDSLGSGKLADLCGLSVRVIEKCRILNALLVAEYLFETRYSEILSQVLGGYVSEYVIRLFSKIIKSCSSIIACL